MGNVNHNDRLGKPDGWHVYHICDGILRDITALGVVSGPKRDVTCVYCGEWLRMSVTPAREAVPK